MNGLFYLRIRMSICVVSLADFHGAGYNNGSEHRMAQPYYNQEIVESDEDGGSNG